MYPVKHDRKTAQGSHLLPRSDVVGPFNVGRCSVTLSAAHNEKGRLQMQKPEGAQISNCERHKESAARRRTVLDWVSFRKRKKREWHFH